MSPIAPRYRGPTASSDDSQRALSPILTIPNLSPIDDRRAADRGMIHGDLSLAEVEASSVQLDADDDPIPTPESGTQPVLGSMQDSIKRISESARKSLNRVSTNNTFNPIETVRGVLPGIVISISIICLWWIIGRNGPTPLRQNVAQEQQDEQTMINPIADEPLRASNQVAQKPSDESPAVAAGTARDEQLFDHVPFINRPTNETVSQSDAPQESATTAPPSNDVPQARTSPGQPQSSLPPATANQSDIAHVHPNPAPAGRDQRIDVGRPSAPNRERVGGADRSTEFEWPPAGGSLAQHDPARSGQPAVNPGRDRGTRQPGGRQIARQRPDRERTDADRQSQPTYTYEQTDPSTYKNPVYNVPPVARRARSAQR